MTLDSQLRDHGVIPTCIPKLTPNGTVLDLTFDGTQVKNAVTLTPQQTKHAPKVTIHPGEADSMYTLLAVDPDAPDPKHPIRAEWLHWIVANVKQDAKGNEVVPYMGPSPPVGSHRYVYLLYHNKGDAPIKAHAPSERANFSAQRFAASHGLEGPVAVVFHYSHK